MSIFQALIYGIIQGVTEFLPISSTAHLNILPLLLHWKDPSAIYGGAFDVSLHLGTALAVILFFLRDWIRLIAGGFTSPKSKDGRLFWYIVAATVPGAIFGVLLDKYVTGFPIWATGVLLIVMGIFLYWFDSRSQSVTRLEKMTLGQSLIIGFSQILAMLPGVSRSGITMTTGRALGITRESAAKFTFLMSTPIILGDALYHMRSLHVAAGTFLPLVAAVVASAVVGILSIGFLLNFLKTKSFFVFAAYRFVVGALVLVLFFAGWFSY